MKFSPDPIKTAGQAIKEFLDDRIPSWWQAFKNRVTVSVLLSYDLIQGIGPSRGRT